MVAHLAQPMLFTDPLEEAEAVILELCRVLLGAGPGGPDRGLMGLIVHGRQHVPTCPHGQWLSATSPRPHGDPCSARCMAAHAAISAAEDWLRAREGAV